MKKYRCIKEFVLDVVGIDGFETGDYGIVPVGSVWELDKDLDYMGGENHLESEEPLAWIEITNEDLKGHFEEI